MRRWRGWLEVGVLVVGIAVVGRWLARHESPPAPPSQGAPTHSSSPVSEATWPPAALASPVPKTPIQDARLRPAWEAGVARADCDLREGSPHLCTIFGMGHSPPYIDATLGIPRLWAGTCVHDDADQVYYEGYVARLAQYGQLRGLPPNSRRPWLAHILAPKRYFRRSGPPISLRPGSTSVLRTPGGSLSIRLSTEEKGVVTLTCCDERSSEFKYPVEASRVEFVWGPAGSRTVFVRAIGRGNKESYAVLATDQSWLMNYVGEAHWFWEPMPRGRGGDFGTTCPSAP